MSKDLVRKRAFVAFLFLVSVFFLLSYIFDRVVVTWGESVPYRVFLKSSALPSKGDYVALETPKNDKFAQGKIITKRVVCVGGEVLKINQLHYYCCKSKTDDLHECAYLGKAKLYSKTGEPVTPFNPCGVSSTCVVRIPNGKYFVANEHVDSYDSRYFGFVGQNSTYKILYTMRPFF